MLRMSDRKPTRWQHNRIYPQPISICECMIVILLSNDHMRRKNAHIVSCALLNNGGQGQPTDCCLFTQCYLEKYPDENNHDHLLAGCGGAEDFPFVCV